MADLKAVIYARYSSSSQREESIEAQLNVCNAYAERNGYVVIGSYADRAKTGTNDNRPELQRMIRDSKRKQFDVVLVYKLDRFARNRFDSATNKAKLKENGVRLVSATESFGDGDESIIIESVLEGYAEYYSKKLKERVIDGLTVNASKLLWNGGTVPIGYVVNEEQRLEKDPMTAPYVVEAFKKYDEGCTLTEIRDYLNTKGITNTRGTAITYGTIQHMLSNRRYIGEYSFRDVIVPDGIPAIVSQDLFDRVQEKLAKNKKAPARAKAEEAYLLATKIYCGHCGTSMNGESGKSRNGTIHRYYKCHAVKKKLNDCKKKSVKKEWIEDLVVKETMSMLMDDNAIEAIVSMLMRLQDEENTDLPMYEKQLKQTQVEIANIMAIFKRGAYSDSLQEELLKLEAQKKEIQIRIEEEKLEKPKIPEDFMRFWLHRFRKLDITKESHRQMLIDTFVNRIYVFDDKLLLTFNYKDGTRTITLTDAKIAVEKNAGSNLDCSLAPKYGIPHWGIPYFYAGDRQSRYRPVPRLTSSYTGYTPW